MIDNNQSFILYTNYYEILSDLSNEKLGELFRAILEYKTTKKQPVVSVDLLVVFKFIKNQLDMDEEKYNKTCLKNKNNAKKGGAPKGNQNARKQPKTTQNNHNDNENDNDNDLKKEEKIKKEEKKNSNLINPDMCFDNKINQVFTLYKKLCPKLIPLVFEERNLDRRIEIDEFLALINDDFSYIEELFKRANKQITFYDNKINLKSLIKNHESIYQGLGAPKNKDEPDYKPPQKTGIIECVL